MGYPAENNTLDSRLIELRNLAMDAIKLNRIIVGGSATAEEKTNAKKCLVLVNENIEKGTQCIELSPRKYDIYLGVVAKAVKSFEEGNPRPKMTVCPHAKQEKRLRTYEGGSSHVVNQCLDCGSPVQDFRKKSIPNWSSLPKFDEEFRWDYLMQHNSWFKSKKAIIMAEIGEDVAKVEFDYSTYEMEFKENNPIPFSPRDCQHDEPKLTLRVYSEFNEAVVEQCCSCGKHMRSVSKKKVSDINVLDEFNEELEVSLWALLSAWQKKFHDARIKAELDHVVTITNKINSGEIVIEDKSTFGSYYDSQEWKYTRQRIFERDEHECQSCHEEATCVHHILYERLGCENDLDLISVCDDCHSEIHRRQDLFSTAFRLTPSEIMSLSEWAFSGEAQKMLL